ncbi:MAG: BglG family transcription antiterminator [Oscillospiraceae bacterium]|nr:BglG family transcription antiterminator [Oscillospiraceae bacterium]
MNGGYWTGSESGPTLSSFDDTDSRIRYILTRLLRAGDFVRIEQLADELFVSRATVDRLMPEIKAVAGSYDLQIVTRPKYGISIQGEEIKKRLCYAHRANVPSLEDQEGMTRKIQQIVLDVIQRHDLVINDINLYNLIRHCVIAIQRMASGNRLTEAQPLHFDGSVDKERQAAQELVTRFEAAFGVEIPQGETQYMMMHLLGKRILKQGQTLTAETLDCIDHVLEEIFREKGLDFAGDAELYTALALHTQPLLSRLRFGLKQENPILQDIKRDMPQAYELAVCAVNVIRRDLALDMSEDETGYLALHFAMALEKRQRGGNDWKVLVVCASGRGTAKLICHRLVERYRFRQENLILTSVFELEHQDFTNILCIFTTVPLPGEYPVPAVMVDLAMSGRTLERVDEFLRSAALTPGGISLPENLLFFPEESFSTKEEVLDFLCAQMATAFSISREGEVCFTDLVKQREVLSSTEVGNQVALPHPYGYQGKTGGCAFLSLKKPIPWKFGAVRLVILLAIPEEDRAMNGLMDSLTRLITNEDTARRLTKDLSRETLEECLREGGREA